MKDSKKQFFSIRDIAKIAGVSTATVSRVINQPDSTSKKIREKVEGVIKEYNYVPNQMAKNLFSQTSNSIAIFVYDVSNPFFTTLITELNNIAFSNQYTLLICDTENNQEKEEEYLRYCQSIRCSGIILTEGVNYNLFRNSNFTQTIACLDRYSDHRFSSVTSDNITGIKKLVDYLYNLNHRKIAYAGAMGEYHSANERRLSYQQAMSDHNLEIKDDYIYNSGRFSYKTGVKALDYFWSLNNRPTAIVCANDQIAQGIIMRAYKLNISIPNDLSIVGFDGVDNSYFYPKITTIQQDIHKLANELFSAVISKNSSTTHKTLDIKMIIGESCKSIPLNK